MPHETGVSFGGRKAALGPAHDAGRRQPTEQATTQALSLVRSAEEELRKRTDLLHRQQRALLEMAKMDRSELDVVLRKITELDAGVLDVERVSVWLFSRDRDEIVCEDLYRTSVDTHEKGMRLQARRYPRYFQAIEESLVVGADDARSDPRTVEFAEGYLDVLDISSMMDVAVRLQGRVVGIVCHEHTGPMRKWTQEEQNFAAAIAEGVSLALEASERRRAEEALRESERRFRTGFDNAPIGMILTGRDGRFLRVNRAFCQMIGYSEPELLQKTFADVTHADDRASGLQALRKLVSGESMSYQTEKRYIHADGRVVDALLNVAPIGEPRERPLYFLAQVQDITHRKRVEAALRAINKNLQQANRRLREKQAQLVHSEKMASLGQLAAGIVHEINNPVGFVMSNLGMLAEVMRSLKKLLAAYEALAAAVHGRAGERLKDRLARIDRLREEPRAHHLWKDLDQLLAESTEGMERVREIVQGLRSFARVDEVERVEADVNEGIEAALKVAWNELKYKCEVHKRLRPVPAILCNPGQLNQVFLNLFLNAAQAIPKQGVIRVESEESDGHIVVRISDTGVGISSEHLPKLFTPFFSTKPVGQGTGLGLSISYGIVRKHNGTIEVQSKVGKGTLFTIRLPVTGHAARRRAAKA